MATCPDASLRDGKKAVEMSQKACQLEGEKWFCLGTLAAAYAEAGDFESAAKYETQAIGIGGMSDKERAEAEQQLTLYQERKPFHQEPKP